MKNEYGKNYYVVKADQVENILMTMVFQGLSFFRGFMTAESEAMLLKAGCKVSPELYKDKGVVILFGQGKGVLKDKEGEHAITELALCT